MKNKIIYQFKIELQNIAPPIWRRIEVPSTYSFWDLHVAIQDAMGWLDYHLHAFRLKPKGKRQATIIGIPDDFDDGCTLAGWDIPLQEFFSQPGHEAIYDYDFGDGWCHKILLEGILLAQQGRKFPYCSDGQRACPPEDCGGIPGYENLVEILRDPKHQEYDDIVYWLSNHAKRYHPYDPDSFAPDLVKFDNPKKRWKQAFEAE